MACCVATQLQRCTSFSITLNSSLCESPGCNEGLQTDLLYGAERNFPLTTTDNLQIKRTHKNGGIWLFNFSFQLAQMAGVLPFGVYLFTMPV